MTSIEAEDLRCEPTGEFLSFQTAIKKSLEEYDSLLECIKDVGYVLKHDESVLFDDPHPEHQETNIKDANTAWEVFAAISRALSELDSAPVD